MPKNVFVACHGVNGNERSCFLQWLKSQIESEDTVVITPSFPNSSDPLFCEWSDTFNKILTDVGEYENLYVLGHSLGGFFILKMLGDELYTNEKLKGVVLVSPTSIKRPERRRFYKDAVNWDNVKKITCPIRLLFSEDDPKIARAHIELILHELENNSNLVFKNYEKCGHFIVNESPEVLEAVKEVLK